MPEYLFGCPSRRARVDWPGAALLTLATTALVLLASLGGLTFAWSSVPIIGRGVAAVLAGRPLDCSARFVRGNGHSSPDPPP